MIKRQTIQCALVLEAVKALKCHATAEEVYAAIAKEHPSVSRTTVYRNLQRLCETGAMQKIEVPEGADRFDHDCSRHYHARCTQCGRVFDVDMDYVADMEANIKDAHGFTFTGHDIIFKGVCAACQGR